jgi:hypothetical protein
MAANTRLRIGLWFSSLGLRELGTVQSYFMSAMVFHNAMN